MALSTLSQRLLAASLVFLPALAIAAPAPHRVPQVESAAEVDGVLDDGIWHDALTLELGYEIDPGENIAPPVSTEVLLAYGRSHLYVGFRALDPEPAAIAARLTDRDTIEDDDWVAIVLDTFNDQRRAFIFYCNPLGIQAERIWSVEEGGEEWDAIWDSAGRITATGFTVEMAIPWTALRFQRTAGDQTWGVDAIRSYPRNVRHEMGLFPRDRSNNCYLCQSEKLVGFAGVEPGRNVEVAPTVSAVRSEEREGIVAGEFVERQSDTEAGLTAHWGMTPNLTASVTLNPDFSQVEADALQLDVNRQFALYYPEKRPFFLEGADFYGTRLAIVYTRALADPRWGVKLTGKEGRHAIGAFVVEDEITNLLFPGAEGSRSATLPIRNTSAVVRYRRDVGQSSTLGLLYTGRQGDEYSNQVLGVDGVLRLTPRDRVLFQFLGSRTRYPAAVAAAYGQPADEFDGTAFDLTYTHATRDWGIAVMRREESPEFRADLGFIAQVDFRFTYTAFRYAWYRDPGHWFTMLKVTTGYEGFDRQDGSELLERGFATLVYNGPRRSFLTLELSSGTRSFAGVSYDDNLVWFEAGFWPAGALELTLNGVIGDDIDFTNGQDATSVLLAPGLEYRLGRHLTMKLTHTSQRLDVAGGRLYTAGISQLRTAYQFTRRAFLRAILQYVDYRFNPELYDDAVDPRFKHLFSQVLFSYKINPQTVLFLGYSDNHFGDQGRGLTQTDRTVFFKVGYAWVF